MLPAKWALVGSNNSLFMQSKAACSREMINFSVSGLNAYNPAQTQSRAEVNSEVEMTSLRHSRTLSIRERGSRAKNSGVVDVSLHTRNIELVF